MSKAWFRQTLTAPLWMVLTAAGHAGEVIKLGPLEIDAPWARASIGTARAAAAYMTIRNTGEQLDRLVGIETPVAARARVHATVDEGGVMRMRPAEQLDVPAGSAVRLEPGGLHIMLMQIQEPLEEGGSFPITLVFEQAGAVTIEVTVRSIAAGTD